MKKLDTIKLIKIARTGKKKRILFASYLKEDFIDRALTLYIIDNHLLDEIHFSSNDYGTAEWKNGYGIVDCHRWEDEDTAQSYSHLSKHYPALLLDGVVPVDYCMEKIVPDVLDNLPDRNFAAFIENIIKAKEYREDINLEQFSIDITKNVIDEE